MEGGTKEERLAGQVDRRIREREGGELARSVVSEPTCTSGSPFGKKIVVVYLLGSGSGSNDVIAVFAITFGRQSLRSCVARRPIYF